MNFRPHTREEPEINLIPFIDVLLVVLIFLMLSTTYSKFTELQVNLPVANADKQRDYPKELVVSVSSDGRYMVEKKWIQNSGIDALGMALTQAAKAGKETVIVINADAGTTHQAVITLMEAARRQGMNQITFATQSTTFSGNR